MPIPVKKISAYDTRDTIVDNDVMLVVSDNETHNATAKVFMEYVKNHPEMDALFATDAQLESVRKNLASTISTETSRAKSAESTLTTNLNTEISRAKKAESDIKSVIYSNKNNWNDKYTKNEIDNKFSTLENNIDWKESVATFADIAKTYPTPQDGWTVNVKDTDYTYRYSGDKWVIISANAIPNATQSVDGLLTKEDKTAYDDANSKKHTHPNKSVLDGITSVLVTAWNKVTDKLDKTGDASNVTNTISTASTRTNLSTGEKLSVSLGKISKYFSDLKTVAFTGSYNDLTNRPTSMTANGGNSTTVNGHTVNSDVPSGAKFTDTVYTHPTGDGNKHIPANGTSNNGKFLKATDTAGSYQWGNVTKSDIVNALGYTPGTSSTEPIVYTTGTAEKEGLTKLYTGTGTATDGTMTQAAIKTALNGKAQNISLPGDTNLNNIVTPGFYNCGGGNTVVNKPTGVDSFGLIVIHNALGTYYTQILTEAGSTLNTYRRSCVSGNWNAWSQDKYTDTNTIYTHPTTSGNKHIPSGGSNGQILRWSSDGTAVWGTDTNTWRGIQDNLTSTSTTESLSAKQGKNLKTSVDNKIIKNSSSTAPTTQDNGSIWLKEYT